MCSGIHADPDGDRVVIYRRSPKSITICSINRMKFSGF
jgi:hypothetical protein